MKLNFTRWAGLLFAMLLGVGICAAAPDADRYNVIWTTPSTNCHGSMPVGNGDIGLNVWVEKDGDLQFYIGKTDAWDDNARLLKVGLVCVKLTPNPFATGVPFRQELSLSDATIKISAGEGRKQARVQVWVDANNPVVHVSVESATACAATASFELWRTNQYVVLPMASDAMFRRGATNNSHAPIVVEPDTVLTGLKEGIGWVHHNKKSVGPQLMAEIQGLTGFKQTDPLLQRTFGALITANGAKRIDDIHLRSPQGQAHRFDVLVQTRHPATVDGWVADAQKTMQSVNAKKISARRKAHEQWWQEFWNRSWIHATADATTTNGRDDGAYVSQMYALQRFVTACSGRGAYPIKFNGSIFTTPPALGTNDADYRKWGPGYWWQNTRLMYMSSCAAGDFDLMQPLFKMYSGEMLELCKYRTKLYTGREGAFFPECIMFWGATFSTVYGWEPFAERTDKLQSHRSHKWAWVGGLELCALLLDYYEHTGDDNFLNQTALPTTREVLKFFNEYYPTNDARGQMLMAPSQALETWWDCTNAMPELAGLHAVTARLLALPEKILPGTDRVSVRNLKNRLPALPIQTVNGKLALAPAEKFANKRNLENPELYAVFPFRLVAFNRPDPELGVNALTHRRDKGAFGWRQDDIFMAYLGLTPETKDFVVARARKRDVNERFPAFWGPNYDWTPDQNHGGVLMKAFQAMLMQTDGQQIFLLPTWPKDWNVKFKLHAPQQTVIECEYRDGKVKLLRVTPPSRKADIVMGAVAK